MKATDTIRVTDPGTIPATTLDFAHAARVLARGTAARGLVIPGFRCPPRLVGVDRSLRRIGDSVTVAVRLSGRPLVAVVADMIDGIVVANRLAPPLAERLRRELWVEVHSLVVPVAPRSSARRVA
jgi:hypothetical protein